MQYSIYDAIAAGFDKLVFIIKPEHRSIIEGFCKEISGIEISFVYQDHSSIPSFYSIPDGRVKPFGTVHAVLCAKDTIKEPFAVINADDFYGREAFAVMRERLTTLNDGEAAMIAYRLKNTVSRNGAVTRGICKTDGDKLCAVTETYKITTTESGTILDADNGVLDGSSLVSMNLWGFTPSVFKELERKFNEFLLSIQAEDMKAEYALPTFVDTLIKQSALDVFVLSTNAVWFGVTYAQDKAAVALALKGKHESGEYPERLF